MRSTSPWKFAVPAAFCTVGIFLSLPIVDLLSRKGSNRIRALSVDALRVPAPPPPALEPPPVRVERPKVALPLPQLAEPLRRLPLRARLGMQLVSSARGGQFEAGFALAEDAVPDLGGMVFTLRELDQPPIPLLRFDPVYPARAKADRIEGEVDLEFVVTSNGDVTQVKVVTSRPGSLFNAAAMRAAEGWRFKPGVRAGESVAVRVRQKVSFSLQ